MTHGHCANGRRPPTYNSWMRMRGRCLDVKNRKYAEYGAKGVTVCDRWATFENFLADMGERPAGMSVDRVRSTENYEPGNCRWATTTTQNRNRKGVKCSMEIAETIRARVAADPKANRAALSREFGIAYSSVYLILQRRIWI